MRKLSARTKTVTGLAKKEILAVQGAFAERRAKLESLGAGWVETRKKEDSRLRYHDKSRNLVADSCFCLGTPKILPL